MIVRCPECQTGFNLSPEKVPAKGAKLRCSQCNHLFRVRITDGRSEIFYKNKAENVPVVNPNNETQMGGLHRTNLVEQKRETEQLNTMEAGGQTSFGYPSRSGTQPRQKGMVPLIKPQVKALPLRAPILTPPAIDRRKELEKPKPIHRRKELERPPKPIKSPSKRKLTPVPSEDLDLFGDDSGFNFSNNDRSVEDPFFGAFDEPNENSLFSPEADDLDLGDLSEASKSDFPQESNSWAEEAPVESIKVEMSSEDFFSRGGSARNYDELSPKSAPPLPNKLPPLPDSVQKGSLGADPSEPLPEIKAPSKPKPAKKARKKAEPKIELAIERKPVKATRPQTAKSDSRRAKKGKKREEIQPTNPQIPQSPIALKPHKIGGNTFRRIFDTLFIGIFLLGSYVGVIAYKTGGFFDFNAPLHMLEVAFENKPYVLSPQLKVKTEKQADTALPYVNNLIAVPHRLKSKDHVLLVNGFINNPSAVEQSDHEIFVEISSVAGEKKQKVHLGESLSLTQLKSRLEDDTFSTLPDKNTLSKSSSTPFFVVFRSPVRFRDLEIKTKIISK